MIDVWFHIDPSSGVPIYRQIVDQVRHAVAGGTLRPGDRLPAVRELAIELAVNPNTIAKAYQDLERAGIIETLRGRGTFVAEGSVQMTGRERVESLEPIVDRLVAEARLLGMSDEELLRLVEQKIAERSRTRQDG